MRRRDDAVDATRRSKRWDAESRTGVVKSRLRHVWRFASVFSRPMDSRRLPTVPVDSSQAKRPLPGSTMEFAVWTSSSAYFSRLICGAAARGALRCCVENVFVGTSADAGALRARARMADFIVDLRVRGARGEWCKFFDALQRRSFCDAAAAREATSLGSGLRPRKSLQSGLQRMRSLTVRFCCTCVPWYCCFAPAAVLKVRGCNAASRSVDVILAVLRVREIASQF